MSPLLGELLAANRTARLPELATELQACGLPTLGAPLWGVSFVEAEGDRYAPLASGRAALIVPVFEDGGALVDLAACGLASRRTATRTGAGVVLGSQAIDLARETDNALVLFSDPLDWLRNQCRGAVVLDWRNVRFTLADVPALACTNDLLAKRVDNALRQPMSAPPIFVKEQNSAAA